MTPLNQDYRSKANSGRLSKQVSGEYQRLASSYDKQGFKNLSFHELDMVGMVIRNDYCRKTSI